MEKRLEALEKLKECVDLEGALDFINEERFNIIEKELKEKTWLESLIDSIFAEFEVELEDNSSADEDTGHVDYGVTFVFNNGTKISTSCSKEEYKHWMGDGSYGPEDL